MKLVHCCDKISCVWSSVATAWNSLCLLDGTLLLNGFLFFLFQNRKNMQSVCPGQHCAECCWSCRGFGTALGCWKALEMCWCLELTMPVAGLTEVYTNALQSLLAENQLGFGQTMFVDSLNYTDTTETGLVLRWMRGNPFYIWAARW